MHKSTKRERLESGFFIPSFKIHIFRTPQQKSGNRELAIALSKWVLKETGVLRIKSGKHHTVGQKNPPPEYTIMDNVVFFDQSNFRLKFGNIIQYFKITLHSAL